MPLAMRIRKMLLGIICECATIRGDLEFGEIFCLACGALLWEGNSTLEIPKPSHKIMQIGVIKQKTSP